MNPTHFALASDHHVLELEPLTESGFALELHLHDLGARRLAVWRDEWGHVLRVEAVGEA